MAPRKVPDTLEDLEEFMELRKRCLYLAIAGVQSYITAAKRLKMDNDPEMVQRIRLLMATPEFMEDVKRGRSDQVASVLERFRDALHKYADEAENIALNGEERNRVTMLKDLMDRAGTGAALKMAVSTPSEYKKMMTELLTEKPDLTRAEKEQE